MQPPLRAVLLRFGEFTIVVESGDERLLERLRSYFHEFVVRPPEVPEPDVVLEAIVGEYPTPSAELTPWGAKGKESFADVEGRRLIRKVRTGVSILGRGRNWTIAGDLSRNFGQLVNLVGTLYGIWLLDQGGAMVHASAAVRRRDGRAVAMMGGSGTAKSSMAVRLLERGFDFLTNDRLILRAQGRGIVAYGLPKLPRVNPGTLLGGRRTRLLLDAAARRRYERLSPQELWKVEDKYDLDVTATLGRRWLLSAELGCALVLSWRPSGGGLTLRRLSADEALESLRRVGKNFGPFDPRIAERGDEALIAAASLVPVYEVAGKVDTTRVVRGLITADWETIAR